ncbi:unnamed protein product [Lymnaea stagnalis]|uniref:Tubulin polymerization-promoting protein family member 3 n=1 Tax=Lymnaea stagnalis TaxID=6523 RepID=A0AAV2ID08_LYMST
MSSADLKKTFLEYKDRAEKEDALKLTAFMKCIEACGLKQYKTCIEASVWPIHQDKAKKILIDRIISHVLPDIAATAVGQKKKLKGKAPADDPEVQEVLSEIQNKLAAKAGESKVKAQKVDATTARLTDASGYTGSHKERFTADGKGKGKDGRVDTVENSGYVGNYKGAGTFDKKH